MRRRIAHLALSRGAVPLPQLRRYRRGNKEPFVDHLSGLGESSVSLGAVFPATYYRPVRVCRNCYRVYSMVDEARTKSVKRLDAQAAAAAADRIRSGSPSRGVPQPTGDTHFSSTAQGSYPGKGEEEEEWERRNETSVSGESRALMRAQAAIDGLTRGDICELRSFTKPPAAVNMVTAALMIALTGQGEPTAAGWLSARRYMTNVDKLFAAISGLDLNTLRVSQTRKLETYTRNPAFRPEIVACVSLPASKICAWVLGVLVSDTCVH